MGYFYDEEDESLEHHGIKGQKWGVRRFEKASGGLTEEGKKRYKTDEDGDYKKIGNKAPASKTSSEGEQKKKGLTDQQKKYLKIGAAVVGTSLAAYGGYKLYQLNKEATEGLSNEYHNAALKKFTDSHAHDFLRETNYSEGKFDRAKTHFNAAVDAKEAGRILQEKAKSKDYSIKDKADYLKNKNSSTARDNRINKALTYNKDGSFTNYALNKQGIKTVQINTGADLVQDLLRKNTFRL